LLNGSFQLMTQIQLRCIASFFALILKHSPQLEPLFPLPAPAPVAAFFNPRTEAESWFADSLEAWCKARGRTGMNIHFGQSRSLHYSSSVAKTYFSNKPQSPFNLFREDALDLVPGHTAVPFSLTLSLNKLSHFPIIFLQACKK